MSDIPPFPATTNTSIQTNNPTSQILQEDVKVQDIPSALEERQKNLKLRGKVIARDKSGNVTVRTTRGDVTVKQEGAKQPSREADHQSSNKAVKERPQVGEQVTIVLKKNTPDAQGTQKSSGVKSPNAVIEYPRQQTSVKISVQRENTTIQTTDGDVTVKIQETQTPDPKASKPAKSTQTTLTAPTLQQAFQEQIAIKVLSLEGVNPKQLTQIINVTHNAALLNTYLDKPQAQSQNIVQIQNDTQQTPITDMKSFVLSTQKTSPLQDKNQILFGQNNVILNYNTKQPELNLSVYKNYEIEVYTFRKNTSEAITSAIPFRDIPRFASVLIGKDESLFKTPISPQFPNILRPVEAYVASIQPLATQNTQITLEALPIPLETFIFYEGNPQKPPVGKTEESAPAAPTKQESLRILFGAPDTQVAQVVGHIRDIYPVVQTVEPTSTQSPFLYVLHMHADDLPTGSLIKLSVPSATTASSHPENTAILAKITTPFITLPGGLWQDMSEIHTLLTAVSQQSAQVFSNITPSPANPSTFTAAAMFFIAAIKGQDLATWLGDRNMEIIRKAGKTDLLSRLATDSPFSAKGSETAPHEWRSMNLPLFWDGQFYKIALHTRQEHGYNTTDQPKGTTTRFIFDLTLPKLGEIQLDGLFNPTRLDLILRSEQHFSSAMRQAMRRNYSDALKQAEIAGDLSFQMKDEAWVTIDNTEKTYDGSV